MKLPMQALRGFVGLSLLARLDANTFDASCRALGVSEDTCLEMSYTSVTANIPADVSYNSAYYLHSYNLVQAPSTDGYGTRFPSAFTFKHPRYNAELCDLVAESACNSNTCTRYVNPLDNKRHYYTYAEDADASCGYYATTPASVAVQEESVGSSTQLVRKSSSTSITLRWDASVPSANREVDFYIAQ
jgi:hypothetical protein